MSYKFLLTFIAVIISVNIGKCQPFWEVLPIPDTLDIASIVTNDDGVIFGSTYSAEYRNGIYKSIDGGYNWLKIFDSGQFGIISMAITEAGTLYALGLFEGIDLLKSTDHGATWVLIPVPEPVLNQKIFLKGEDTIFISQWRDQGAYLLRSIDRGQNWDIVFQDYGIEYVIDMAFGSDDKIYLGLMCYMENDGGIFGSTDGGTSWEFLGLENHQVSSISIDSSNNLLVTVWSNMIDIWISGNFYYDHLTNEFIPLCYAFGAWGSTVNSQNEFFTTYEYGSLHSTDSGLTFEEIGGNLAAGCDLYLTKDQYIYGLAQNTNYMVKSIEPTVTAVSYKKFESNSFKIAPNPIKDQVVGTLYKSLTETHGLINIIDTSGKSCLKSDVLIEDSVFKLNVSKLPPGIYYIQLYIGESMYSAKILKG